MNRNLKLALLAGGVVGLGVLGWMAYGRFYAKPAESLRDRIAGLRRDKGLLEDALLGERRLREDLNAIVASSVHGDRESLDHRLRTVGSALATEAGLGRVEVNAQSPRALGNPAARARGVRDRGLQRAMRDRVDAIESRVVVQGVGTLDAVLRALALAESQPWSLGVDSWSIRPERSREDGGRALFSISLTMTALVTDDRGAMAGEIALAPLEDTMLTRVASVVVADPFRTAPKPAPVVVAAPPPPPDPVRPPPPPPPPGDGWRLAGVLEGESGAYAIVVHRNGQRRTIALGEEVGGLRLASVLGETATFEAGQQTYEVRNGEPLAAAGRRGRR